MEGILALNAFTYANSALNPIIYTVFSRKFRRRFKELIFCRKFLVEGEYSLTTRFRSKNEPEYEHKNLMVNFNVKSKNNLFDQV